MHNPLSNMKWDGHDVQANGPASKMENGKLFFFCLVLKLMCMLEGYVVRKKRDMLKNQFYNFSAHNY